MGDGEACGVQLPTTQPIWAGVGGCGRPVTRWAHLFLQASLTTEQQGKQNSVDTCLEGVGELLAFPGCPHTREVM